MEHNVVKSMHDKKTSTICLGIESTAHTFGVAMVSNDGRILSDYKSVYHPPLGKGIHPREAAQHHGEHASDTLKHCLESSGLSINSIDCVAFSSGPGLGPVLRTGASIARALAIWLKKPLIPIHHAIGHIELACKLTGANNPLIVLVSGGHTMIGAYAANKCRVFGETEDITLGNLLDVFGREAGLPFPSGPYIEKLAKEGSDFIYLPYAVKGNDVSYSGLLTATLAKLKEGFDLTDLCFSLQEVSFSMLTETTERALPHIERDEVLLTGGVAANARLSNMLRTMTEDHNAKFFVVPIEYCGDCGAQIAWTGILAYESGVKADVNNSFVIPRWRIDDVEIPWRC